MSERLEDFDFADDIIYIGMSSDITKVEHAQKTEIACALRCTGLKINLTTNMRFEIKI